MVKINVHPHPFQSDPRLDDLYERTVHGKPRVLTVSNVERLAKAGVKIDYADIKDQLVVEDEKPEIYTRANYLVHMLRERLMNRGRVASTNPDYGYNHHFEASWMPELWAVAYKDKVHVFVATGGVEPVILEDDANLFPSDTLLAKYDLLLKTHPHRGGIDPTPAQSPGTL